MALKRTVIVGGSVREVEFDELDGKVQARLNGAEWRPVTLEQIGQPGEHLYLLFVGTTPLVGVASPRQGGLDLTVRSRLFDAVTDRRRVRQESLAASSQQAGGPRAIKSTIAGMVVDVVLKSGAQVKSGDTILIIEAMKMQNEIKAPADGVVSKLSVGKGDRVERGVTLAVIEPQKE